MDSSARLKIKGSIAAAIALAAFWADTAAAKPLNAATVCESAIAQQERAQRIPPQLLHAISIVESGRWSKGEQENTAWPWTVMAEGKGRYLPSKSAAIREVRALQRRGIRNIDVGCMQVNLKYHPDAFKSLQEAFDPTLNARYAATFLVKLRREKRSWTQAVKHYHSATRSLHGPYRNKVYAVWRAERRKARKEQITLERERRQQSAARRAHARAERLLADNRFSESRQRWLEATTESLLDRDSR